MVTKYLYFFDFLKVFPDVRHKVDGLIEVGGAQGVVLDELDVVVLGQVALAVIADSINYSNPEILNCSQEVFVANEIAPHSATICPFDLLGQMIYKDFKYQELNLTEQTIIPRNTESVSLYQSRMLLMSSSS